MSLVIGYTVFVCLLFLVGGGAWYLTRQKQRELMLREALDTSRSLETLLEERLSEMDDYRHELAEVLQSLDIEQVREADEGNPRGPSAE